MKRRGVAEVLAPLLSVNEPEAQVVAISVSQGTKVKEGETICTLQTVKATFDVTADSAGYARLLVSAGQLVKAGEILAEISSEPFMESEHAKPHTTSESFGIVPEGLRISKKGLRLANELCVSLDELPKGPLITEAMVFELKTADAKATSRTKPTMDVTAALGGNELLIMGAGGHAKSLIDLVRQANRFQLAGVVDDDPSEIQVLGVPVLGTSVVLASLFDRGIRLIANGVGGTNSNRARPEIFERLASYGFAFPTLVHPRAAVEPSALLEAGVQVFGSAFVGSDARVGIGAIINTGAIVSHDCRIGEYAHLTPGAILAGHVEVGVGALVGMGVTTTVGVKIGAWAKIGNSARILGDVPAHSIVQAGASWPG